MSLPPTTLASSVSDSRPTAILLIFPSGFLKDVSELSKEKVRFVQDQGKKGFSARFESSNIHSMNKIQYHRTFLIHDGGTFPESQARPSEAATQDDPEDRTSKDFRILDSVTFRMGPLVTTSAPRSVESIEYDTIGLSYNGNAKVYEGS